MFHRFSGSGEPLLVFIHGLGCSHRDWDAQVARFQSSHRCLVVDLPGHGESAAGDQPLTIERFAGEVVGLVAGDGAPAVLLGHSMGCRVALTAANRLRGQALAVVTVDGSCFASGDPEAARAATLAKVSAAGFTATVDSLFLPMFTGDSPATFREQALARAHRLDPVLTPGLLADMTAWDAGCSAATLDAVEVPLMAIQSTTVDASRTRRVLRPGDTSPWTDTIAARVPEARIELLPGYGHFTMVEAADAVNALIDDFLRGLAGGSACSS